MRWLIVVVLGLLSTGCVAQSSKRMGAHNARDAVMVHKANPTEASDRLVRGTAGQTEYLGEPKIPVKVAEFEADLQELHKASEGLLGGGWLAVVLGSIGSLAGAAVALWTGNYVLAARKIIGILTSSIETTGTSTLKKSVATATKGLQIGPMLDRWVTRAESKNGEPVTASSGL